MKKTRCRSYRNKSPLNEKPRTISNIAYSLQLDLEHLESDPITCDASYKLYLEHKIIICALVYQCDFGIKILNENCLTLITCFCGSMPNISKDMEKFKFLLLERLRHRNEG
ncbi:hypothetical protein STEG23_009213 [Scotinomys teguina]